MTNPITEDGPLLPVILRLAAPAVLMMYLQNAYNIIDTIWVGQLLGSASLAGIANGGYVLWTLFGLVQLISVGLVAVVARRVGEGQIREAERTSVRGLVYTGLWSLLVAAATALALPALFDLMNARGAMRVEGMDYMYALLWGAPFIFLSFTIGAIYRAAGDTITPMWLMALSLAVNGLLDPVLMLGLFGLPAMGIAGAAWATVIARAIWVLLGLALLHRGLRLGTRGPGFGRLLPRIGPGLLRLSNFGAGAWGFGHLPAMVKIGLPHATSVVLFPVVYMFLVRIPAAVGEHQVSALRIGHTVEGMTFFLAIGVSMATATLVGQNLGAGKPARAARFAWTALGLTASVVAVMAVLFYFLAAPISAVFSPEAAVISAGAVYLRILAWSQLFMAAELVLGGGFNGAGSTVPPTLVAVPLNLLRIPLAYWLADGLGLGVIGVWWAISGTTMVKGALILLLFSSGRWARRVV